MGRHLQLESRTEDQERLLRDFLDRTLEDYFKFSKVVEQAVRTEFFRGRRTLPVAEYGRCVRKRTYALHTLRRATQLRLASAQRTSNA